MTEIEHTVLDKSSIEDSRPTVLTLERAAYIAVGLLAAALRFFQLGLRPLVEGEADQALAAFRFVQGTAPSAPAGTVPALFTGNVAAFTLLGASDITARWLPALAGLVLALLPFGLRHRLGRGGALATSVLLALSPSAVYASRSLDSAVLVAACGLALAVAGINYLDTRRPGFLYLGAVALGLGLVAGPAVYTLLLTFVAFGLLLYAVEQLHKRETGWSSLVVAWSALRTEKGLLARGVVVAAATFGLAATAFVLYPGGMGHAADLIGAWAQSFLPEEGGQPLIYPLLLVVRYESLIMLLGLIEVGWWLAGRRRDQGRATQAGSLFPHTAFFAFWAGVTFVVVLLSGHRPTGSILLVVAPLALLAGQGIERAWRWVTQRGLWEEAAVFAAIAVGLLVFLYLQLGAYAMTNNASTFSLGGITLYTSTSYLLLVLVALLLLAGLAIVGGIWRGAGVVLAGAWLTVLIALGLFGFRAMWSANFSQAGDARELMVLRATAPEVRLFVDRLEALSLDQAGDAHTLAFTTDAATGPVVAWYLRDFERQTVVDNLSAPPATAAAVTLAARDLPIGETFRGQGFPLRRHWLPWGLWQQGLVRWLLFGEGDLPVVDQEVVLWVQSGP